MGPKELSRAWWGACCGYCSVMLNVLDISFCEPIEANLFLFRSTVVMLCSLASILANLPLEVIEAL